MYTIVIVVLALFVTNLRAQNPENLLNVLAKSKEDTAKVNTLLLICRLQQGSITEVEKMKYASNALLLSEKLGYIKGVLAARIILGGVSGQLGKYDESLKHLNEALRLALKNPADKFELAQIYGEFGNTYYDKGDYTVSTSYYLKSMALFEEMHDLKRTAQAQYNIASVYYQNGENQNAEKYILKAYDIYEQLKDSVAMAMIETQMGGLAYDAGNYAVAIDHFNHSLRITEKLKDKGYSIPNLVGIGNVLFETAKYNEAIVYSKKALGIAKEVNDLQFIAISLRDLGRQYACVGKYNESIKLLNEALDLAKNIGAKKEISDCYSSLSEAYEKKRDFEKALEYAALRMQMKDSIFNEENASQINELSAKYENEKKEREISMLSTELFAKQQTQELLDAKVKEKNTIIISLVVVAILVFVSVFLFYSRQKLRQKNQFQTKLNEQQKSTAGVVIQIQENERSRIASELHDGVGTFLSTLKINLQVLESSVADEKTAPYKNSKELIDKTSDELRRITKGLSNETLQENGLVYALQELAESINASGMMQLKLVTHGMDQRFDPILETNLYRVAQELINNCIRHANATKATLQLIDHENSILLMLEDNGIGFDMHATEKKTTGGMGFKNIKSRVNFLGGTVKVESTLGNGSTFIIEVPRMLIN